MESSIGELIPFNNWLSQLKDVTVFNVVNDLIVNGVVSVESDNSIILLYEDLHRLDKFEYNKLNLSPPYPFEIFIDIIGSGLRDANLQFKYSFQDFTHGNGSGNVLFSAKQRQGAHLEGKEDYLLSTKQYLLLETIDQLNQNGFLNSGHQLKAIARLQKMAAEAKAVLSKILVDTLIVAPEKIKLQLEQIGEDKFRLQPAFDAVDNEQFQKKFNQSSRVKANYSYRNEERKKVRVIIDNEPNEDGSSIGNELGRLKAKATYNKEEINEIYNSPTKFWDVDLIDLNDFGERVLELGLYKPKFYPFISPYKSQWIPGIAIDDQKEGTRLITIDDNFELETLKTLVNAAKEKGESSILFKEEIIELENISAIIENAEKQLKSPLEPVVDSEQNQKEPVKVLLIKENTEQLDYIESPVAAKEITYDFQSISNLAKGIQLKEHQKNGIAWLQTLSNPSYAFPGVLLADDMGLGKTLQVLYFVEWFVQRRMRKPILVVAPVSLLENWKNEYSKFFPSPNLSIETLWGKDVKKYIIPNDKNRTVANLNKQSIFLTTYETLRRQQIPLGFIDWGVVVLDEAQKIKTPGTFVTNAAKALKATFKIAMTGTPVENTLMDLWCIVDFCSPGLLGNAKSFINQFQKPLKEESVNYDLLSTSLREKIGQTLLRRMKIDVAKDLPTIDYLKLNEVMPQRQFDAYQNELVSINRAKESSENNSPVLQGILNLKSISDHPSIKNSGIETLSSIELVSMSAKLKKTMLILKEIEQLKEKAIVFTANKSMQRILRRVISDVFSMNPSIINGETPTSPSKNKKTKLSRQQEIDKYQAKEGFNLIIMSPIAAGFGLNITEANHIVHYTRHWNPAKEQQATDRAYRIGQKKPVMVYYPLAVAPNDELETFDIILDRLLSRKAHLATSTLFPTQPIEIKSFSNSL